MGKVYELYALESLLDMETEELPLSMWLPYVQLESERFLCKETGEIWHRFEGVTVYMEDEEFPEGDLLEEVEKLPDGLISWQGQKGAVPEAGDVFRVLDSNNQVVFEETISGESKLYGVSYATSIKEEPLARDLLRNVEQALKGGLGDAFTNDLCIYAALEDSQSVEAAIPEKTDFSVRGIRFVMFVEEREATAPVKLRFYDVVDGNVIDRTTNLLPGDKWYEVGYNTSAGGSAGYAVGWGLGSAKEAAEKIRVLLDKVLDSPSLAGRLGDAFSRAGARGKDVSSVEQELL